MRNFVAIITILFACLQLACKREVDIDPNKPLLIIKGNAFGDGYPGTYVYVPLKLIGQVDLVKLELYTSVNGEAAVLDSTVKLTGRTIENTWTYFVGQPDSLPSTIHLNFVTTDVNGKTANAEYKIHVPSKLIAFGASRNGFLYNHNAPLRSVNYDLVNDASRLATDTLNADMVNTTPASAAMVRGWRSPATDSKSFFWKVSGIDFSTATVEQVFNSINVPGAGNINPANVQVDETYAFVNRAGILGLIKIVAVNDTDPDVNNQRIQFTYKKQE